MTLTAQETFHKIGEQLSVRRPVKAAKMFGVLCLKVEKKGFASYWEDTMAFKLSGEAHAQALALPGAQLFDPTGMNRPMKEWVQVPFEQADRWPELAEAALDYVTAEK